MNISVTLSQDISVRFGKLYIAKKKDPTQIKNIFYLFRKSCKK